MGAGRAYRGLAAMAVLAAGAGSAPAMPARAGDGAALPPIGQEPHIVRALVSGVVGDRIRQACPDISARMLRVADELWKLERYARRQGYTEADVRAFLRSGEARAEIRAMADAYLASKGVEAGDVTAHCRLGREEIARNSQIGILLKDTAARPGRAETD